MDKVAAARICAKLGGGSRSPVELRGIGVEVVGGNVFLSGALPIQRQSDEIVLCKVAETP
jgi:osmotically-inducible protein OsmY